VAGSRETIYPRPEWKIEQAIGIPSEIAISCLSITIGKLDIPMDIDMRLKVDPVVKLTKKIDFKIHAYCPERSWKPHALLSN
jgi:hypothetical protein